MKSKKGSIHAIWLTFPALVIYSCFYVIPLIAAIYLSFTDWNSIRFWTPEFIGVKNFVNFLNDINFVRAVKNTFSIAFVSTIVKVGVGFILALALTRPLKSRNLLRTVFFMPTVLSTIIIGLVFSSIFRMKGMFTGLLNVIGLHNLHIDWLGVPKFSIPIIIFAETWQWTGLAMIIFIAGIQSIPKEFYEAADIDGATAFQRLRFITIPMLTTAFNFSITTAIIGGLKIFAPVYVLTKGGPGFQTDVLTRFTFSTFGTGMFGKAAAISLFQSLIIIILSLSFNAWMKKKEVNL